MDGVIIMLKNQKEYIEKYGDIPKDMVGRIDYLLRSFKTNRSTKGMITKSIKKCLEREWEEINYTIYLLPKATPRPRSTMNGFFYVKGASDNKSLFKKEMVNFDHDMIYTPCEFYCNSYLPIPKAMNNLEKILAELGFIYPLLPDFDNLIKTYTDMIKGTLIYDDSIIQTGVSRKYYSVKPRIEITIRYMKEFDSNFNQKKIQKNMK